LWPCVDDRGARTHGASKPDKNGGGGGGRGWDVRRESFGEILTPELLGRRIGSRLGHEQVGEPRLSGGQRTVSPETFFGNGGRTTKEAINYDVPTGGMVRELSLYEMIALPRSNS